LIFFFQGLTWRRHHDDGHITGPVGPNVATGDSGGLWIWWRKFFISPFRTIPHQGVSR